MAEDRGSVRGSVAGPRAVQLRPDEDLVQQRAAHRFRQTLPERRGTTDPVTAVRPAQPHGLPDRRRPADPAPGPVQPSCCHGLSGFTSKVRVAASVAGGSFLLWCPYSQVPVPSEGRQEAERRAGGGRQNEIQLHRAGERHNTGQR